MARNHVVERENAHAVEMNSKFVDSGIPPAIKAAMEVIENAANDPIKMEALRKELDALDGDLKALQEKKDELEERRDKIQAILDRGHEVTNALALVKEAILEAK